MSPKILRWLVALIILVVHACYTYMMLSVFAP